jgi:hypothetical protein
MLHQDDKSILTNIAKLIAVLVVNVVFDFCGQLYYW